MSENFISEAEVEQALHYLVSIATEAAQARANRLHVEEYRKVVKAQIMSEYAGQPIGAQERMAYADERYIAHLEAIKTAVFEDEKIRFLVDAAKVRIESWRTQSATERAMKL